MKLCKFFLILTLMITIAGCTKAPIEDPITLGEKIKNEYTNFPAYTVTCTVKVNSNKTENTYKFKIKYISDDLYTINYDTYNLVQQDGKTVLEKGGMKIETVPVSDNMYFLPSSFFGYYFSSGSDTISIKGEKAILSADIPNGNIYQTKMHMYIDTTNLLPVKQEIMSFDGEVRILIDYSDFQIIEDTTL